MIPQAVAISKFFFVPKITALYEIMPVLQERRDVLRSDALVDHNRSNV
jgi:hypothetical protein